MWSRPALAVSSSVVALCLTGEPVRKVQLRNGRGRDGLIYDIWSPWQVLKIQCFPDEVETQDSHDFNGRYLNGPEAFLRALLSEFHDAEKRFVNIHDQVIQLVKASSVSRHFTPFRKIENQVADLHSLEFRPASLITKA